MDFIKLYENGFPLTIERLVFLQNTYKKAFSELAKGVTGNAVILYGVVNTASVMSAGAIVTPTGEVLAFEGGVFDARVAIFETVTNVPYNIDLDSDGVLDTKVADTVRVAKCAATGGLDSFLFSDLKRIANLQDVNVPVNSVIMYAGDATDILPAGWEWFDMVNKFPMGAGGTNAVGATGGANSRTIAKTHLPSYTMTGTTNTGGSHTHPYRDSYYIEAYSTGGIGGNEYVGAGKKGSSGTDDDNSYIFYRNGQTSAGGDHSHNVNIETGGGGNALDNRPAFKALLFIKRVAL
jgi:hypothetical protein